MCTMCISEHVHHVHKSLPCPFGIHANKCVKMAQSDHFYQHG